MAIESINQEKRILPDSRTYYCLMGDNFDYKEMTEKDAKYKVEVEWSTDLIINITELSKPSLEKCATITIEPRDGYWNVGVSKVLIVIHSDSEDSFTVGWKAFEQELIDNAIKADIVQLNGYYQYNPKLKCKYESNNTTVFESVLQNVVSGDCVGELLSTSVLADIWGINQDVVLEVAEKLRSYGYEIRNHNTNPQIIEGEWLIPYAFPTLTKLSVQLRKKVR